MKIARPCQRGFILVVTLWVLAITTIGASYFAERVASSTNLARQSSQISDALLEIANTRAEIFFRMGTTHFSVFGLGGPTRDSAIALDNRPYRGTGQAIVRLQDSRGLININFAQVEMLLRLLGQTGVAAERRIILLDTLNDYTDTDDLRRINGAEAAEYRARGLPPPANDWLMTPWQLPNIIGWREEATHWKAARADEIITTARVAGFNPNTAPREVLATLPGGNPELADRLIQARSQHPFYNDAQMNAVAGQALLDSESLIFFPADSIRISFESKDIPWAFRYQISLTPFAERAPWRIDYYIKTGVTSPVQNENDFYPLPKRTALFALADEAL